MPGFVTVALQCSGPSGRCGGSSHGLRACCLWDGTPARLYLCQKRRPKPKLQWHSWPVRVPPAVPEEVRSLSVADLLEKRIFLLMGQPNRFQICISPFRTGSRQSEGATGGRGGRGMMEKVGERTRTQGGVLHQGVPGSPGSGAGATLERCCSHMASFSLWEHLLSFISVSWIYRITLVSVGCRVLASFR